MFQDRFDLSASEAGEPLQNVVDSRPGFKILKQCFHENTSPPKDPHPADLTRHSFYSRALTPIQRHDREPSSAIVPVKEANCAV